jgi:hypothetical protein
MVGPADSNELLLVHHAILEEIESQVQTLAHGRRVFPYGHVTVTLVSADPVRRTLYEAAFGTDGRLESDVREALDSAECTTPRGFGLEVKTAEAGAESFTVEYAAAVAKSNAPVRAGRLIVVKGKTGQAEYTLQKARTNLGRLAELTDTDHRLVRRNDVVFEEGADEANATVSRRHAHIRLEDGEYRICDDGSEYGTRVLRDGRAIDVPAGNRRGERLRPGDEIFLGRACLRFER